MFNQQKIMTFYNPFRLEIKNVPIIVYPSQGLENVLDRTNKYSIERNLFTLYKRNSDKIREKGEYHIVIQWAEKGKPDIMTDVWIYDKVESWGSGPLVDAKVFRDEQIVKDIGVGCGNELIMLGREEEHRRNASSLKEYLRGIRPTLPDFINLKENFFK